MKTACYCSLFLFLTSINSYTQDLSVLDGEKGVFFDKVKRSPKEKIWEYTKNPSLALYWVNMEPGITMTNLSLGSSQNLFILGTLDYVLQIFGRFDFEVDRSLLGQFNQVFILEAKENKEVMAWDKDKRLELINQIVSSLEFNLTSHTTSVPGKCIGIANRKLLDMHLSKKFNGSILERNGSVFVFKGYRLEAMFDFLNDEYSQRLRYDLKDFKDYYDITIETSNMSELSTSLAKLGFSVEDCKLDKVEYLIKP